jgi:hypothetical protein
MLTRNDAMLVAPREEIVSQGRVSEIHLLGSELRLA